MAAILEVIQQKITLSLFEFSTNIATILLSFNSQEDSYSASVGNALSKH